MRRVCCSVREFPEMESVKVTGVFIGFQKRKWLANRTVSSIGQQSERTAGRSAGSLIDRSPVSSVRCDEFCCFDFDCERCGAIGFPSQITFNPNYSYLALSLLH